MDDVTSNLQTESTEQPPSAFEILGKHLALFSALGGLTVLLGSTVFLYGYLAVFDWRLIWVIEYSDILKFALVIFGILTGAQIILQNYVESAYNLVFGNNQFLRRFIILLFLLSFIQSMLRDETRSEHYYALHIYAHLSVLAIVGLTWWVVNMFRNNTWKKYGLTDWTKDVGLLIIALSLFGQTFGFYTRDMSGFKHDVFLKGEEMRDAGIIMITSHHTVLYSQDGKVIIVPSADVNQIVSKPETK